MSGAGNCGKCGVCLAVCPVYAVLKEEQNSPRARIQLIQAFKNNKLPSSPLLKELISKCLMCGSCAANCPSGVDHYSQFMEMRFKLIEEHGDRLEIRGLVYLLAKEQRLRFAMGAARMGQAVVPAIFQKKYRLGNIPVKNYPRLNKKTFRSEVGEEILPMGEERGTVLYFTGCGTNYIFGETGHAALTILSRLGYRVIIPKKQTCCSIPMLFHGGTEQARDNIITNIECLRCESAIAILVDCPTCGSALRDEFPAMMRKYGLDDTDAELIAAKTRDMTAFIAEHLGQLTFRQEETEPVRVGYHLPCHLKNVAGTSEAILRQIPAVDYVQLDNSGDCCGGGGTFFYEYPELSGQIAAAKITSIKGAGVKIWITDCPVCRINLAGQLAEEDDIEMMHPLTLLAGLLDEPDTHSR